MSDSASLNQLKRDLRAAGSPARAHVMQRFFKTGPGQYGAGDRFVGASVPAQRKIVRAYRDLPLSVVRHLLHSAVHEERLIAVLILVEQYKRADVAGQKKVVQFYLANLDWVNNWDIVDSSAPHILGTYLLTHPRSVLKRLVRSKNMWHRRVAVLSTQAFIRQQQYRDTLRLCQLLLRDPHDLIHKATGWMLREVGNRDSAVLKQFLNRNAPQMPRTMLRYAIEKLPARQRAAYLAK